MQKPITKRRLKPFRQVIAERYKRRARGRTLRDAVNEEVLDMAIGDTSSIMIHKDATPEDRADLINRLVSDINDMVETHVIAVAYAVY
jgi:hypothetical protein